MSPRRPGASVGWFPRPVECMSARSRRMLILAPQPPSGTSPTMRFTFNLSSSSSMTFLQRPYLDCSSWDMSCASHRQESEVTPSFIRSLER
jgi:hypothetical protein